jgi:hypothetical protein
MKQIQIVCSFLLSFVLVNLSVFVFLALPLAGVFWAIKLISGV